MFIWGSQIKLSHFNTVSGNTRQRPDRFYARRRRPHCILSFLNFKDLKVSALFWPVLLVSYFWAFNSRFRMIGVAWGRRPRRSPPRPPGEARLRQRVAVMLSCYDTGPLARAGTQHTVRVSAGGLHCWRLTRSC
jgi:hypothetical protein